MTTVRSEWLAEKLGAFLKRYNPPNGKLAAEQAAETQALLRTLERYAPRDGYADWWERFADDLGESMHTRTWPTQGDLRKVAEAMPKRAAAFGDAGLDMAEHARQWQLRQWWAGKRPVAPAIVTRERCRAVGMTDAQAADAVAFVADPENAGCDEWVKRERRT